VQLLDVYKKIVNVFHANLTGTGILMPELFYGWQREIERSFLHIKEIKRRNLEEYSLRCRNKVETETIFQG
jgi:hypothetical protein